MLLIYTDCRTPRLEYVLQTALTEVLQLPYRLFGEPEAWQAAEGALRLNLSAQPIDGIPHLPVGTLLRESGVRAERAVAEVFWAEGLPAAFPCHTPAALLPFYLWDWLFYLLVRYEEYLPFNPDAHGRFSAAQSLAHRAGFLHLPVVDAWLWRLAERLGWPSKPQPGRLRLTLDIDYAFCYRGKGWWRSAGGWLRRLLAGQLGQAKEQIAVALSKKPDPFDTFDQLQALHRRSAVQPFYFWLVGDYGKYDKNCNPNYAPFRRRLLQTHALYGTGWHPSYSASQRPEQARLELQRLQAIVGQPLLHSRQHFLRLNLPASYRLLLDLGIRHDHTLGYADAPGFRASIARPFFWYDLRAEQTTELRLHPFAWMDVTLHNYLRLDAEQALQTIEQLLAHCLPLGAQIDCIWHNNSLTWGKDWWKVLEYGL